MDSSYGSPSSMPLIGVKSSLLTKKVQKGKSGKISHFSRWNILIQIHELTVNARSFLVKILNKGLLTTRLSSYWKDNKPGNTWVKSGIPDKVLDLTLLTWRIASYCFLMIVECAHSSASSVFMQL